MAQHRFPEEPPRFALDLSVECSYSKTKPVMSKPHSGYKGIALTVRVKREVEPIDVVGLTHRFQSFRHTLGVTVLATGTDLGAARNRVPRRFRPLDR